jgi:hypothetical protein
MSGNIDNNLPLAYNVGGTLKALYALQTVVPGEFK